MSSILIHSHHYTINADIHRAKNENLYWFNVHDGHDDIGFLMKIGQLEILADVIGEFLDRHQQQQTESVEAVVDAAIDRLASCG